MRAIIHSLATDEIAFNGLTKIAAAENGFPSSSGKSKKRITAFPCKYRMKSTYLPSLYDWIAEPDYNVSIETNPEKIAYQVQEIFYRRLFEERDAFLYAKKQWDAYEDVIALNVYRHLLEKYGCNTADMTKTINRAIECTAEYCLISDDDMKTIARGVNRHFPASHFPVPGGVSIS